MAGEEPKDPLSRYFEAAMGLTELTRKRAEKVVRGLTKQGEEAGNPRELVENLLERSQENREALVTLVRSETKRAMKAMGLATSNDVQRLEQQLKALRRELADAREETVGATEAQERVEEAAGPSEAQERAKETAAERTAEGTSEATEKPAKKAAKKATKKSSS